MMVHVSEQDVREALTTVTDFDRGEDVVSLGMVSGIEVDGGQVRVTLKVPGGATAEPLRAACERTLRERLGVPGATAVLENGGASESGAPCAATASAAGEDERIKEQIIEALRTVHDPEIPVNIYELGLIYRIELEPDRTVYIEMTLTAPGCPVAGSMPGWIEDAIRMQVPEISDVRVEVVWDPPWTIDRMTEAARLELGFL